MPPFDSGDDAIGTGGPDEGLGILIVLIKIAVDSGLEIADGTEDATLETALGECGEEALDRIQPGAGGGDEVESEALVPCKPCHHLGMLMGGIVIEDEVDGRLGRYGGIDRFEKSLESDHIPELLSEFRIARELEGFDPMRALQSNSGDGTPIRQGVGEGRPAKGGSIPKELSLIG